MDIYYNKPRVLLYPTLFDGDDVASFPMLKHTGAQ